MSDFIQEEITVEEKLQIVQHYLLSSPPGQFQEVLADVKRIIPNDILSESLVNGIARVSNIKNSRVVVTPSGKKVVLAQAGEVDQTHYVDSTSGSIFAINHLTLITAEDNSVSFKPEQSNEQLRSSLQAAASSYIESTFPSEYSAAGVFSKDGKLVMVITGERPNLRNFWSGRWTSTWTINISERSFEIDGEIKLHVHYFEDGNLQLQSGKVIPSRVIAFSSQAAIVEEVMNFIQSEENLLQTGLEDMYTTMNEETFRSMRRLIPVTRTKMDWNVNAVRMVRQVRK